MPDLGFQIAGVEAVSHGLVPLLRFRVTVKNPSPEAIHSILLRAQIQIQAPRRSYTAGEKQNLIELFGTPDRWGQTLRNRLWTVVDATVAGFQDQTEALLFVPCTYDLSLAATKFFYGLEGGEIPLLFLFSGTVFHSAADGRLQAGPISWNTEAEFRMPLAVWTALMEQHFPNSAWLYLRRDVFNRLYASKRAHGDATWEQTIERLLHAAAMINDNVPEVVS